MAVLKKQSLVDQLYEELRNEIINLKYPLGEKLVASDLEKKYQVSSTPVREALNRLQREGLVEYENNIGAKIITIEEKDVYEIQELAMTLHKAAICFSMEKSDHRKIAEEVDKYIEEYEVAKSPKERTMCVHRLIGVFYKYSGNRRLDMNMGLLKGQQLILRNLYNNTVGLKVSSSEYYKRMKDEILKGNTEGVIKALEEDGESAIPVILKAINKESL
ncbi:GntR family transcriptional regulator [Alloiococcus sp. CFN-8]|uniref:GntR family transcriptional regulator n=1 Tax=Alloiococcus sp. CFN-8 TaxID=3416081 RepID=UPI003CF4F556